MQGAQYVGWSFAGPLRYRQASGYVATVACLLVQAYKHSEKMVMVMRGEEQPEKEGGGRRECPSAKEGAGPGRSCPSNSHGASCSVSNGEREYDASIISLSSTSSVGFHRSVHLIVGHGARLWTPWTPSRRLPPGNQWSRQNALQLSRAADCRRADLPAAWTTVLYSKCTRFACVILSTIVDSLADQAAVTGGPCGGSWLVCMGSKAVAPAARAWGYYRVGEMQRGRRERESRVHCGTSLHGRHPIASGSRVLARVVVATTEILATARAGVGSMHNVSERVPTMDSHAWTLCKHGWV